MSRTHWIAWCVLATGCVVPAVAWPQAQGTLEERLRTQLRTLNAQNQQMQAEKSAMQTALRAAESERDAVRKELAAAEGALETSTQRAKGLAARQRQVEDTAAARAKDADDKRQASQQAAQGLQQQLTAVTKERTVLADGLRERSAQVQACGAMNARLLTTGKEILDAYEKFGVIDAVAYQQPFAAGMRVRLENEAQAFGDKLYENRFDSRAAGSAPKPQ